MFRLTLVLSLLSLAVASPTGRPIQDLKIVGGDDIDITEAPYQVSLVFKGHHACGGTIIDKDIVVTAAHCVENSEPNDFQIRAGSSSFVFGGELYPVGDLVWHPGFKFPTMDYDIAVMWLPKPFAFSDKIAAIPMIDEDEEIDDGEETTVTGWGYTQEHGQFPSTLQRVKVPIVNEETCKQCYASEDDITPRMLCAGLLTGGKDACQGDSGGPLVYNGKLAGVVSWGKGCARPMYPGVYSKVSNLRPWAEVAIAYMRRKHLYRAVLGKAT